MQLSEDNIVEFQRLYKIRYGREISRELALEQGIKLLRLLRVIYKPMTEEEYEKTQEHQAAIFPDVVAHIALHEKEDSI